MLSWDPEKRPNAQQAMKYPFFEQSKRPTANILAPSLLNKSSTLRSSQLIPTEYLVTHSQFYQPVVATKAIESNASLINGSTSSLLGGGSQSVSTMNTINDILNNLNLSNESKNGQLTRQSSKEKINELLLFSTTNGVNGNKPESTVMNNTNGFRKGFFLHQPSTNFPDSGIGDEEAELSVRPSHIKEVPVVVHQWPTKEEQKAPPKRRLSNLSLMAKMTPVDKWALYDVEGNDGDDEHDDDDVQIRKKYDFNNNAAAREVDDDELANILG